MTTTEVQTIEDLRAALRPGGDVYAFTQSLGGRPIRVHKTYVQTLVATLCRQKPGMVVTFKVENPENTGHWHNPRRWVFIY